MSAPANARDEQIILLIATVISKWIDDDWDYQRLWQSPVQVFGDAASAILDELRIAGLLVESDE